MWHAPVSTWGGVGGVSHAAQILEVVLYVGSHTVPALASLGPALHAALMPGKLHYM